MHEAYANALGNVVGEDEFPECLQLLVEVGAAVSILIHESYPALRPVFGMWRIR